MSIRLSVSNFGPIREGRVEVKPVTIFIGPNNTGKSFYSTFVYAALAANPGSRGIGSDLYLGDIAGPENAYTASTREAIQELAFAMVEAPGKDFSSTQVKDHQKEVLLTILDRTLEIYARRVSIELERCLGGRSSALRRASSPTDAPLLLTAALADRSDVRPTDVSIPAGDVGAYLFLPDEGGAGTSVQELRVTETEGVPDEEFGKVAEAIYDEATDLRYRLIEAGAAPDDDA